MFGQLSLREMVLAGMQDGQRDNETKGALPAE
jgi:hypothetical protein